MAPKSRSDPEKVDLPWFGRRLRALRESYGRSVGCGNNYTAKDFAEALGIEPRRYGRYERGELEPPFFVLKALRRVTGVSLCSLVAGASPGLDCIPPHLVGVQPYQRVRMLREVLEQPLAKAASIMGMDERSWSRVETGDDYLSLDKATEFAHHFGDPVLVGLDWIVRGITRGVPNDLLEELVRLNPVLRAPKPRSRRVSPEGLNGSGSHSPADNNGQPTKVASRSVTG